VTDEAITQPSEDAMRFVIKWHSALGLDPFGCQILGRAVDELLAHRTPDIQVSKLASAAQDGLDALQSARAFILKQAGTTNRAREDAITSLTAALASFQEADNG